MSTTFNPDACFHGHGSCRPNLDDPDGFEALTPPLDTVAPRHTHGRS